LVADDPAAMSGGATPGGSITFRVFGPQLISADAGHKITVVVSAADREHQTSRATAKPIGPIKT
jgi:hypothetical protein